VSPQQAMITGEFRPFKPGIGVCRAVIAWNISLYAAREANGPSLSFFRRSSLSGSVQT
jgi:hypothetical protein